MGDCRTAGHLEHAEALLLSARSQLAPRLTGVINALASEGDTGSFFAAGAFLQDLQNRLRSIESDSELLHLILDISLINYQGFAFSASAQHAINALHDECEKMARTTTARNASH